MNHRRLAWCLSALLCVPFAAAHLAGGVDTTVDTVTFDVGWDPDPILAGASTTFSFTAVGADGTAAPTLWVRVLHGTRVVFAGDLHTTDGVATIGLVLPDAGTYDLTVRSEETSASMPITAADTTRSPLWVAAGAGTLCVVLIAAWMIAMRGKSENKRKT